MQPTSSARPITEFEHSLKESGEKKSQKYERRVEEKCERQSTAHSWLAMLGSKCPHAMHIGRGRSL